MKYLLDTCTVSDFVKGESGTMTKIKHLSPSQLAISSITFLELRYGLLKTPEKAIKIKDIINEFLNPIVTIPFDERDAYYAANIRHHLRGLGTPIGNYDLLIAGTALHNDLTLVTSNTREFERVMGLSLENWRTVNI